MLGQARTSSPYSPSQACRAPTRLAADSRHPEKLERVKASPPTRRGGEEESSRCPGEPG